MQIASTINQLIHDIYQGVMEEEPWNSFLHQLNSVMDADLAVLVVVPGRQPGNRYMLNRVVNSKGELPGTANHWIALDPFQDIPANQPVLLDELYRTTSSDAADNKTAIEGSTFYKDLIQPSGIRYIAALNIPATSNPDLILKLRVARKQNKDNFDDQDIQLLGSLILHLQQALLFLDQIAIQQIERNAFADAINQFMLGTLILDRAGKIVASNRVARDTIEQHQALSIIDGALKISDKPSNDLLYQALGAIEEGLDNPLPATINVSAVGPQPLGLMIRPTRTEDVLSHPVHAHAVLFISDPQGTPEISATTLKELFGFTGSESRVAAYLANGHTLQETSEALSISVNTVKSHARNIYEKTGVNKQTKFIQLISNSVARVS